jgi:hypothetical protein
LDIAVLLPLLLWIHSALAVAWTVTALDVYIAAATYRFYAKTSPAHLSGAPSIVGA